MSSVSRTAPPQHKVAWIHGYTMSNAIWGPLWQLLPPHWRNVGLELPGHGEVPGPLPRSLDALADDMAERLAKENIRSLVALSFGSCVALHTALRHPDCVDRLVLAAPTFAGPPADDPESVTKMLQLWMVGKASGPGPIMTDLWMAGPPDIFTGLKDHPEPYQAMRKVILQHRFEELLDGRMAVLAQSATHTGADLQHLAPSTLTIVGTADMPRFRENARILDRQVPDHTLVTLPGAGHLPLLEYPEAGAAAIAAHLDMQLTSV